MSNLKKKSVDGIIWNLIEKYGIQLVKLILGIVLARILTPADYGLIGIITVFFVIANVFIDSGFGLAYIQKKDANDIDASTIFYFNLLISILLYGLLWFFAPKIAEFYEEQQLIALIRTMGIIMIINSFSIIQIAQLTKKVDFKKKAIILLFSSVISGIVGIIAALNGYGVWSLVIQGIVNASIRSLGLWIMYKWRPLFIFNFDSLRSLFSFSSWALMTNVIRTIFDNIYILVIGKFFPAAELGFYTKAKQFQEMVSKQTSMAVGSVAFPVFSHLQDDKIKLKNAIRKFSQYTLFFVVPISAILFVVAKPLILILLTEKWLPLVPYFRLLLISGILYPMHMVNVQVLSAQGKVKLTFVLSVIKNFLRIVNIAIMYKFGVIYIIYGEVFLSFVSLIINTYYTNKFINYGFIEQIKDVLSILISSIVLTFLGLILVKEIDNSYLKVVFGLIFVLGLYFIIMKYINKTIMNYFLEQIKIFKSKGVQK